MTRIILILLISSSVLAKLHLWGGYGVMSQSKMDYERENNNNKLFLWGLGYGFMGSHMVFFEAGYGKKYELYENATTRKSFIQIGYDKFFNMGFIFPYVGLGYGYFIDTVEAKKRGSNWQVGEADYDVTGIKKRSSLTRFFTLNVGTRIFQNIFNVFSLDFNAITLTYDGSLFRHMTSFNLVATF